MKKSRTMVLHLGALLTVGVACFMWGQRVASVSVDGARSIDTTAVLANETGLSKEVVLLENMDWPLRLDQPIRQLEGVLEETYQQQPMNRTSANIAFLYDVKLSLLFEDDLRGLPEGDRAAARKSQAEWLGIRKRRTHEAYMQYDGGTLAPLVANEAFIEETKVRIAEIEGRQREDEFAGRDWGCTLTTRSYVVTLTHLCKQEGCVSCDNILYHGVSKRKGTEITLKGSTWYTYGPDGVPSRFIGYRFTSGDITYTVERNVLTVMKGDQVLAREGGTWDSEAQ
jgi:uncharacterized protein YecT (DUF1311 family)